MATAKPSKPNVTLPESFGGVKTPYSDAQIRDGYQVGVPQVVDGGNVNFEKDALFQNSKYLRTVADALVDMPIGKVLTVDSNNRFEYVDKPKVIDLTVYQLKSNISQTLDDSTTKYPSNNAVKDFIGTVYPVGSLFFSTAATCPLQALKIGTWKKVGTSLTLSVNTSVPVKGNGMTLGLTNGTTNSGLSVHDSSQTYNWRMINPNAYGKSVSSTPSQSNGTIGDLGVTTDSSKSGIVGTVTITQITVNVFQRIS